MKQARTPAPRLGQMASHSEEAARLLRALANPQRLRILCLLVGQELTVGRINENLPDLSQSALSQHLAKLRAEGLVATRKQSQTVYYRIAQPEVLTLLGVLHDLYCPTLGVADPTGDSE